MKIINSDIYNLRHSLSLAPKVLHAAQDMVMAMADAEQVRGKTTFFGADKYMPAYRLALEKISVFIETMYEEQIVFVHQGDAAIMKSFQEYMEFFSLAYPNWKDAYSFMNRFLDSQNSPLHSQIIEKNRRWSDYLSTPAITRSKSRI